MKTMLKKFAGFLVIAATTAVLAITASAADPTAGIKDAVYTAADESVTVTFWDTYNPSAESAPTYQYQYSYDGKVWLDLTENKINVSAKVAKNDAFVAVKATDLTYAPTIAKGTTIAVNLAADAQKDDYVAKLDYVVLPKRADTPKGFAYNGVTGIIELPSTLADTAHNVTATAAYQISVNGSSYIDMTGTGKLSTFDLSKYNQAITVQIIQKAITGSEKPEDDRSASLPLKVAVPARGKAPVLGARAIRYDAVTDSILGVTAKQEFSLDGGKTWSVISTITINATSKVGDTKVAGGVVQTSIPRNATVGQALDNSSPKKVVEVTQKGFGDTADILIRAAGAGKAPASMPVKVERSSIYKKFTFTLDSKYFILNLDKEIITGVDTLAKADTGLTDDITNFKKHAFQYSTDGKTWKDATLADPKSDGTAAQKKDAALGVNAGEYYVSISSIIPAYAATAKPAASLYIRMKAVAEVADDKGEITTTGVPSSSSVKFTLNPRSQTPVKVTTAGSQNLIYNGIYGAVIVADKDAKYDISKDAGVSYAAATITKISTDPELYGIKVTESTTAATSVLIRKTAVVDTDNAAKTDGTKFSSLSSTGLSIAIPKVAAAPVIKFDYLKDILTPVTNKLEIRYYLGYDSADSGADLKETDGKYEEVGTTVYHWSDWVTCTANPNLNDICDAIADAIAAKNFTGTNKGATKNITEIRTKATATAPASVAARGLIPEATAFAADNYTIKNISTTTTEKIAIVPKSGVLLEYSKLTGETWGAWTAVATAGTPLSTFGNGSAKVDIKVRVKGVVNTTRPSAAKEIMLFDGPSNAETDFAFDYTAETIKINNFDKTLQYTFKKDDWADADLAGTATYASKVNTISLTKALDAGATALYVRVKDDLSAAVVKYDIPKRQLAPTGVLFKSTGSLDNAAGSADIEYYNGTAWKTLGKGDTTSSASALEKVKVRLPASTADKKFAGVILEITKEA